MQDLLAILKKTQIFQEFPEDILLTQVLPHGQFQDLAKGQAIYEPQQKVDQFSVILSGKIHIMHIFPDGNYSLMIALTSGDLLGLDLIYTRTRIVPYHAVAVAPTRIISFPAELLCQPGMLREPYRLAALDRLLIFLSHHNMKKEYRLAILSQKGLRERIMAYLIMQANRRQATTFKIPFNREELASYLCVNRSALSHELSKLEQEGMISFYKNSFTLHNHTVS